MALRPARVTGRKQGQGKKQQHNWEAPKRTTGSHNGICAGLCHLERNGLLRELGNSSLGASGKNSHGAFVRGKSQDQGTCRQPPPSGQCHTRPCGPCRRWHCSHTWAHVEHGTDVALLQEHALKSQRLARVPAPLPFSLGVN